jgi:hypothetical protein
VAVFVSLRDPYRGFGFGFGFGRAFDRSRNALCSGLCSGSGFCFGSYDFGLCHDPYRDPCSCSYCGCYFGSCSCFGACFGPGSGSYPYPDPGCHCPFGSSPCLGQDRGLGLCLCFHLCPVDHTSCRDEAASSIRLQPGDESQRPKKAHKHARAFIMALPWLR